MNRAMRSVLAGLLFLFAAAVAATAGGGTTVDRLDPRGADAGAIAEGMKLPAGDAAYLEIQDFCGEPDQKAWFDLAYRHGQSLWRIDFARVLERYFRSAGGQGDPAEPVTELVLAPDTFEKLLTLSTKFECDLAALGLKVTQTLEGRSKSVSALLTDNRVARFTVREGGGAAGAKAAEGGAALPELRSAGLKARTKSPRDGRTAPDNLWVYSSSKAAGERQRADDATERKLDEKVTFNVTNRPVWEVLEGFLRSAELNASVSHAIQGNVTLYIKDATVRDVLDHLCKGYGLVYRLAENFVEIKPIGGETLETIVVKLGQSSATDVSNIVNSVKSQAGSILVDKKTNALIIKDTPETIVQLRGMIEAVARLSASDRVVTRLLTLLHAEADKIRTMLQKTLTPEVGNIEVDARTNTLVITDVESKVDEIEGIVRRLDTDLKTSKIIACQYVTSEDLKTTLNASLKSVLGVTSDAFLIESDKTTNSLIVTASPINLAKIEEFIRKLDVRTRQVQIEAKIVQVNLTRDESLGVNWDRLIQTGGVTRAEGIKDTNNFVGLKTFTPVGEEGIGGLTYKIGSLTTDQLRLTLQALARRANSHVVACPTITTTNRKKAFVNVETTYPVRRETVVSTNTGPVTSITYDKQNVSVRLDVTPAINPDGYIAMEINPKVQGLAGNVDNSQPIVSTKESNTNIVVKNGHTIIIAGLIEESRDNSETDIPVMSRAPLIGYLFRNKTETTHRNETIIFITPRVVESGIPSKSASVASPSTPIGAKELKGH